MYQGITDTVTADLTVRPAVPDDYETLCELLEEVDAVHREALPHLLRKPDGPGRGRDYIVEAGDINVGLFVAEVFGEVVGAIRVNICEAPPEPDWVPRYFAVVDDLVVRKGWRRRGVGRALMG